MGCKNCKYHVPSESPYEGPFDYVCNNGMTNKRNANKKGICLYKYKIINLICRCLLHRFI